MFFLLLCLFLLLQYYFTSGKMTHYTCFENWKPITYMKADIILSAFIPIYFKLEVQQKFQMPFDTKLNLSLDLMQERWTNYQYLLTSYFAVEEINKDANLLPNVTLGFHLYNALNSHRKTLEGPLMWLSGRSEFIPNYKCRTQHKALAIVAGIRPEFSAAIGTLLELYKIPQVSYGVFDSVLSDKDTFPSLYQMSPKHTALTKRVISLLLHFGWKWVGLIVAEDLKGMEFLSELKAEIASVDICVAFIETIPANWKLQMMSGGGLLNLNQHTKVNVYVFYGDRDDVLFFCIINGIMSKRKKVWIMAKPHFVFLESAFVERNIMMSFFEGSFSFSKNINIPGFKHFLEALTPSQYPGDLYFHKFWLDNFFCSPPPLLCTNNIPCPLNTSLKTKQGKHLMITSESSVSIWNAMYAVAHALHEMLLRKTGIEFHKDTNQDRLLPWQLHPFLRKIQFTNAAGDQICFDENKNHVEKYDVQNFLGNTNNDSFLVKVGEFVSKSLQDQGLFINEVLIKWPRYFNKTPQSVCTQSCGPGFWKFVEEERPACCFSCVVCPERHISNQTDQQECMPCPIQEYPNTERNNCLPKSVTFLSLEDSLGMALVCTALCFSVSTTVVWGIFLKHQDSPIVKANNRTLSFILLISLLLCFLCSFLFIGQPSTASCILQQITFALAFTLALSTVLAKSITVILAFSLIKPGRTMRRLFVSGIYNSVIPLCVLIQLTLLGVWMGTSPPYVEADAHSAYSYIIILCNKGSVTSFYCVLAYLGILALGSFTVAFLGRDLPGTFNEAKLLTFSMLVFCSVWVTFLPVYHSTNDKAMVAVEVFSILASSAGLLGCIFFPKCYIILLRPDKNSLKCYKNKTQSRKTDNFDEYTKSFS
ncbi:vomeronasal type-2 receptor 116-like [Phodopus roborovskii]|uniref:vomeronasal type-2 receptor 116-like n=1 Tax=Phodopus roborovskii TaxID=109678 RepID=UPI0021E49446|nr:vomeronasal type-2 receptor 116-like [Phodopus roborovskii]